MVRQPYRFIKENPNSLVRTYRFSGKNDLKNQSASRGLLTLFYDHIGNALASRWQKCFQCVIVFAIAYACLNSPEAAAKTRWYWKKNGRKDWSFALDVGARYFAHYNQKYVISTPPPTLLGEAEIIAWYKKAVGLYVSYGFSLDSTAATALSAGAKIPFLSLSGDSSSFISGVNFLAIVDLSLVNLPAPIPPMTYNTSNLLFRYGLAINWGFANTGIYLDTTAMLTNFNGNVFLAPYLGLGCQF